MPFNFAQVLDRRATNSTKWKLYGPDILPLWIADMDFPAPEPIRAVLRQAVEHGIFGYELPTKALRETVAARMDKLYGWQVLPAAVVATPGVIAGFNAAARTVCAAGEGILVQPPVYPPFLAVHANNGLTRQMAELKCVEQGNLLGYEIDWDALEAAFKADGVHTGMFLLCNPHNPTGQVFSRSELLRIASTCAQNNTTICSDEIHSELLLGETKHLPLAALDPEIAARTITLIAPSKTFNIPGLFCGFAVIPNPKLREKFKQTVEQMAMHVNNLGLVAAQPAYSGECDDWLVALRKYLTANRDFLVSEIQREFPGIRITVQDATYLAWLDCRELVRSGRIEGSPHKFFLHKAKVALNDGAEFGPGGEGFVRLNFGCPRKTLEEALEKMKAALV
ncbi:MAG: putative C-S lyase [Chloroflexi bacterium]|nr:putative C-S lyase [Chloroflexota bacterium]